MAGLVTLPALDGEPAGVTGWVMGRGGGDADWAAARVVAKLVSNAKTVDFIKQISKRRHERTEKRGANALLNHTSTHRTRKGQSVSMGGDRG